MMLVMMLWYYDNGSPREYKIYNKSNTPRAGGRVGRLSPNNFLSPLPSVFAFWGLAGSPQ